MPISFQNIAIGQTYTRAQLAQQWGYASFHAIARGLVTPSGTNTILLFITEGSGAQTTAQKYTNTMVGNKLHMEGPNDHFAEQRLVQSNNSNDVIHLFYRSLHKAPFEYRGKVKLVSYKLHTTKPSEFVFV